MIIDDAARSPPNKNEVASGLLANTGGLSAAFPVLCQKPYEEVFHLSLSREAMEHISKFLTLPLAGQLIIPVKV
ncbi:MAG: hypothetical protein AB7W37_10730 [Syntrophobacteraceae bacterium]